MSTLLHLLKEANIPLSLFCEKLKITEDRALEIAHTADDDTQMLIYMQFVTDESLFSELLNFYTPFVKDKVELAAFISSVLCLTNNNIPRRMLNSIHRLVTLADAMEQVRPGKDSLKIFFFVVCIETLYHLRDGDVANKTLAVIDFFDNFIEAADKQIILDRFQRSLGDERYRVSRLDHESAAKYAKRMRNLKRMSTQISMDIFARIVNEIRNCFAHEGDYWKFNFAKNDDTSMLNSLIVAENQEEDRLKRKGITQGLRRVYEVDLTYEQFKAACVRGFLQFVKAYSKNFVHSSIDR